MSATSVDLARPLRGPSLASLYADLLGMSRALNTAQSLPEPRRLREHIEAELQRVESRARQAGYGDRLEDARFAVIALIDEMILRNRRWEQRDQYLDHRLQKDYFNTLNAGEEFFERLERLRRQPEENRPVLELYSLCLAVGFEGKYFDASEREKLIAGLARDLARGQNWGPDELAPHWQRTEERPETPRRQLPVWIPVAIAVVAALLLILLFRTLSVRRAETVLSGSPAPSRTEAPAARWEPWARS